MEKPLKSSTKVCPNCKNTKLLCLFSLNMKICTNKNCNVEIPWFVSENQEPLIKHQR